MQLFKGSHRFHTGRDQRWCLRQLTSPHAKQTNYSNMLFSKRRCVRQGWAGPSDSLGQGGALLSGHFVA
jgi:hypothetical protein